MARDRALTGAQKAAVFILHMGKERSAEVLRSMRETEVAEIYSEALLIDPTRNSVSQLASRFAARSAFPNPPHHSNWPFETSATPAPVTWFFSTASFMAFCNSSSVFGCGGSSLF